MAGGAPRDTTEGRPGAIDTGWGKAEPVVAIRPEEADPAAFPRDRAMAPTADGHGPPHGQQGSRQFRLRSLMLAVALAAVACGVLRDPDLRRLVAALVVIPGVVVFDLLDRRAHRARRPAPQPLPDDESA